MTDPRSQPNHPTSFEMLESILLLITGTVLAGPMLPGFVLTVPALVVVGVAVLAPVVAVAALVALAGAILAIPYLLVRAARGTRARRTTPATEPGTALAVEM